MAELQWFEYSGESTDVLLALEGKYRTDSLVVAFDQALGQKSVRVGEENLAPEERVVLAIEALEGEVNNGGYHQFFINSSKEYAPIIVDALKRIGSIETAKITQGAIDALGIKGTITIEAVDEAIQLENEKRDERLGELSERYFSEAGDLSEPLFRFIKANKAKIVIGM